MRMQFLPAIDQRATSSGNVKMCAVGRPAGTIFLLASNAILLWLLLLLQLLLLLLLGTVQNRFSFGVRTTGGATD